MKLPDTIQIADIPYAVIRTRDHIDGDDTLLGRIDYLSQTIKVRTDLGDEVQRQTTMHEIIHGVFDAMGRHPPEVVIDGLAHTLCQVLADNLELVKLFTKD